MYNSSKHTELVVKCIVMWKNGANLTMSQNHTELEEMGCPIVITQPPVVKTIKGTITKPLIPFGCILPHKTIAKIWCILLLSHMTLEKIGRYLLWSLFVLPKINAPACAWCIYYLWTEGHGVIQRSTSWASWQCAFCVGFVIQTYETICFWMKCNIWYWHKITMHSMPNWCPPDF